VLLVFDDNDSSYLLTKQEKQRGFNQRDMNKQNTIGLKISLCMVRPYWLDHNNYNRYTWTIWTVQTM